jgi:hypothetical protein
MFDIVIIVEDKNDVFFVRDFISKNYKSVTQIKPVKKKEAQYVLNIGAKNILIRDTKPENEKSGTGGWSKLKTLIGSNFFKDNRITNGDTVFIALFDGDEDKSDKIEIKEEAVKNWLLNTGIIIHRFYIPFNNEKSHNLEQLLELCFKKPFKSLWKTFMLSFQYFIRGASEPKSKKGKIITYKEIYSALNKQEYLSDIWNIEVEKNIHLRPLKGFLDNYMQ